MNSWNSFICSKGKLFDVLIAVLVLIIAFTVNFSTWFLPGYIRSYPAAVKRTPLLWEMDLSSLPKGSYYVSVGRPTGRCDLEIDASPIASTRTSEGSEQQSLSLGASFINFSQGYLKKLKVECRVQKGFPAGLTDPPILLPYIWGRILQFYREFVSIWLGGLASFFLLISVLTLAPPNHSGSNIQMASWSELSAFQKLQNPFILFALAAFAYGCSLSYLAWILIPSDLASYLHIVIRASVSFWFIQLFQAFLPQKRSYAEVYGLMIAIVSVFALFGLDQQMVLAYKITHPLFAISTFLLWRDLEQSQKAGKINPIVARVALIWAIAQSCDFMLFLYNSATYNSAFMLAFITGSVSKIRRIEVDMNFRTEKIVNTILHILTSSFPLDETMSKVASLTRDETHFDCLSVYVDSFCVGTAVHPHKVFHRIYEYGYPLDSERDSEIHFDHGQGSIMLEALKSGKPLLRIGKNETWYCVIPIGRLACINLSDTNKIASASIHESFLRIQKLLPVLRLLEDRLIISNIHKNIFLQRVKSKKGFGSWDITLGVIRIDIEDSSILTSRYQQMNQGKDIYGHFVQGKYIPSLLKHLSGYAELETQIGDELYLVVIPELYGLQETTVAATAKTLYRLIEFIEGSGSQMCIEEGFNPVRWLGGAATGPASLICDEYKIRTSGEVANLGKRLLDSSIPGSFLLGIELSHYFENSNYVLEEPREYLVKKDRFTARPLYYQYKRKKGVQGNVS